MKFIGPKSAVCSPNQKAVPVTGAVTNHTVLIPQIGSHTPASNTYEWPQWPDRKSNACHFPCINIGRCERTYTVVRTSGSKLSVSITPRLEITCIAYFALLIWVFRHYSYSLLIIFFSTLVVVHSSDFNDLPYKRFTTHKKYYEKPCINYASLESVCGLSLNKARKESIRLQFDGGDSKLLFLPLYV